MADLLTTVSVLFIVAGPFLLVANRFKLPTVPLLIVAGLFSGIFVQEELTLELAQYGIALLVFWFGVKTELDSVRTVLKDSEVATLAQIVVVGSLGIGLGLVLGIPFQESIYLGIAAALSSTIVGAFLLQKEMQRNVVRGRLGESIHFVQDLIAVILLLVLGAGTFELDPIATQLGYGVLFLIGAAFVNRYIFDLLGRLAGGSSELMIVGAVSILVLFIGAARLTEVSIIVGAFAAGLAIRHDRERHLDLFNGIESIKDFFVAIFFLTIGALVTLPTPETLLLAAGLVVLTAVVKPAVTTVVLIYQGYEARSATLTSLGIDQVSEFSLIIAIQALLLGALGQTVFDAIILAAAMTMITSSLSQRFDERIYQVLADRNLIVGRHSKIDASSRVPEGMAGHVIVVGYGRQGRKLVRACRSLDQACVVVENDPEVRQIVREECEAFVFGDAMDRYTWEKAQAGSAKLILSTVPYDPISKRILELGVDADVVLNATEVDTALDLMEEGALYVVVSDLLAGEQLVTYTQAIISGEMTPEELRSQQMAALPPKNSS